MSGADVRVEPWTPKSYRTEHSFDVCTVGVQKRQIFAWLISRVWPSLSKLSYLINGKWYTIDFLHTYNHFTGHAN